MESEVRGLLVRIYRHATMTAQLDTPVVYTLEALCNTIKSIR